MRKIKPLLPLLIFATIYFIWFSYLESTVTKHYRVIHMKVDNYIPFCELFIIPYLLWFVYVAAVVLYLLFKNETDYYKSCVFLFTGMTIFLIISTLWPNGHHLRPFIMPRDNIFTHLVSLVYKNDTPTNLWPSIHVYNSLGAHIAVRKCKTLASHKWITLLSFILCVSIILSTVMLKQHSVFDVITAFILATVMYVLVYRRDLLAFFKKATKPAMN